VRRAARFCRYRERGPAFVERPVQGLPVGARILRPGCRRTGSFHNPRSIRTITLIRRAFSRVLTQSQRLCAIIVQACASVSAGRGGRCWRVQLLPRRTPGHKRRSVRDWRPMAQHSSSSHAPSLAQRQSAKTCDPNPKTPIRHCPDRTQSAARSLSHIAAIRYNGRRSASPQKGVPTWTYRLPRSAI